MPTILRFRGFNIMIFVDEHEPAHVHAIGHDARIVYNLHCPDGPVAFRDGKGFKRNDERALQEFLNDNMAILCERWREIDDQRTGISRG